MIRSFLCFMACFKAYRRLAKVFPPPVGIDKVKIEEESSALLSQLSDISFRNILMGLSVSPTPPLDPQGCYTLLQKRKHNQKPLRPWLLQNSGYRFDQHQLNN